MIKKDVEKSKWFLLLKKYPWLVPDEKSIRNIVGGSYTLPLLCLQDPDQECYFELKTETHTCRVHFGIEPSFYTSPFPDNLEDELEDMNEFDIKFSTVYCEILAIGIYKYGDTIPFELVNKITKKLDMRPGKKCDLMFKIITLVAMFKGFRGLLSQSLPAALCSIFLRIPAGSLNRKQKIYHNKLIKKIFCVSAPSASPILNINSILLEITYNEINKINTKADRLIIMDKIKNYLLAIKNSVVNTKECFICAKTI